MDSSRGEGVAQAEVVIIEHGQSAAPTHIWCTVGEKPRADPHGRTKETEVFSLCTVPLFNKTKTK